MLRKALLFAMRAAALAPALLGLLLLSAPAESGHERNHRSKYREFAGTCNYDDDCEDGLTCMFGYNKYNERRKFCQVDDVMDRDIDGIPDGSKTLPRDNCPNFPNPDQADYDVDGIGDRCDKDIDADGVPNAKDNCPFFHNPKQRESDTSSAQCSLQLTPKGCVYRHPRFPTGCPVRVPVR